MSELEKSEDGRFYQDISKNGKTVTVAIEDMGEPEEAWDDEEELEVGLPAKTFSLTIIGDRHQQHTWTEWFVSPEEALQEAYRVIEEEGIDEFYRSSDFSYLDL